MSTYKILFTGPVGAGKTTAITSISDIEPFQTEESATDDVSKMKDNTTVAMDYGLIKLEDGERIHLYGTPGQERFDFMWEILSDGAIGLIILMNNLEPDPLQTLEKYLDAFSGHIDASGIALGVTRMETGEGPSIDDYHAVLSGRQITAPVMEVDPRVSNDVIRLTESLLYSLDPGL
ncbi:GTP-binding protein [Thiohalophilus thiocyanatoxydans]|uniref:Signal recognition particle receptor subunit beta n=1 Tax=Thiohalophilus thiocyanatoxydans TaxID=381308 RepID=A0A4R8IGD3_9GAMM|nr:ATP/GTP-binding protein [Thiohalophilus thiocyanatoxydans]TDX99635.1 hypothetical protein EDC23_2420 [Thiohalophilus thiocyanatoxydans]